MSRKLRLGFSAVELAMCLAITAVMVPIIYRFAAGLEDRQATALWHVETADAVRTVAEELRLDARRGTPGDGVSWTEGDCEVRYRVTDQRILLRDAPVACGGTRGLARNVESITRDPAGAEVVFTQKMRPERENRSTIFIALESR